MRERKSVIMINCMERMTHWIFIQCAVYAAFQHHYSIKYQPLYKTKQMRPLPRLAALCNEVRKSAGWFYSTNHAEGAVLPGKNRFYHKMWPNTVKSNLSARPYVGQWEIFWGGVEPFNFEKLQGPDVKYKHRPIPIKCRLMLRVAQTALLMLVYWYTRWINDNVSTIKSHGNGQMQWWLLGAVGVFLCDQVITSVTTAIQCTVTFMRRNHACAQFYKSDEKKSDAYFLKRTQGLSHSGPRTDHRLCFHRVASRVTSYMTMIYWSFKKATPLIRAYYYH